MLFRKAPLAKIIELQLQFRQLTSKNIFHMCFTKHAALNGSHISLFLPPEMAIQWFL